MFGISTRNLRKRLHHLIDPLRALLSRESRHGEHHGAPAQAILSQQVVTLGTNTESLRLHAARNHVHADRLHARPFQKATLRVFADRHDGARPLHQLRREPARRLPRLDSVHHEQQRHSLRYGSGGSDRKKIDVAADHDIESLACHGAARTRLHSGAFRPRSPCETPPSSEWPAICRTAHGGVQRSWCTQSR